MERLRGDVASVTRGALFLVVMQLSAPVSAQDAPPWLQMTVVQVDPTRLDEFLAAQGELSALEQEAGPSWRSVSRTAVFGDTYRFIITTPLRAFAGLDRAVEADPARSAIINRIRNAITSRQTYAIRATPTIDNPLPDDEAPALMLIQFVSVVPGREQDYLRVMANDVLPHFDEAEMHHTSGALTFGGVGGYVHIFHVQNFAALDQGSPLARALGADGAQEVTAKLSGVVARSEQWLVRLVSELSYGPWSEPDAEP